MTNIFIFTAGKAEARTHLADTIERPVPASQVLKHFREEQRAAVGALAEEGGFYAWGAVPGKQNTPRWKAMLKDDWVLCVFEGRYRFACRVREKFQNAEFARAIWGEDADGQTWELMYFLTKPQPINVAVAELGRHLSERYMGFFRIGNDKIQAIEREFGSVDEFVASKLLVAEDSCYLVRSNPESKWADEIGKKYRFGDTVHNYKKLLSGGSVIVDCRIPTGVHLLGYGRLGPAHVISSGTNQSKIFEAPFLSWNAFSTAQVIPAGVMERIKSQTGYNAQFAIRPISRQIFDELVSGSETTGCWIFQANPEIFNVRAAARDLKHLRWLAKQHGAEFKTGDTVYLWEAGASGGIVAEAAIVEPTHDMDDDASSAPYRIENDKFAGPQPRVVLEIKKTIEPLLGRDQIRANSALKDLSILKAPQGTNFPVTHGEARAIQEMLRRKTSMDLEGLRKTTLLDDAFLQELVDAIVGPSRQIILAGPPGTGKTLVALALAEHLTSGDRTAFRFVQFHPSYSYESFIEGLRPVAKEGGGISFEKEDGVVLQLVKEMKAKGHVGEGAPPYVIVIDEINRANLPRVLGELMFLMEYRERAIRLQYSEEFSLPPNLRFIATMNTADRSIRSIDIALRRRFDVFELGPSIDVLKRYFEGRETGVSNLMAGLAALNTQLEDRLDRHHTIGHGYFMRPSLDRVVLRQIWERKIFPLIEEYFFDQEDIAKEFTLDKFWPESGV